MARLTISLPLVPGPGRQRAPRRPRAWGHFHGFTLLEVMVAVALLSLGIVLLLQVQARSIQLAQQARNLSVATGLARAKLYDCQADLLKKGFSIGDYDESGKFDDDGYEGFESFFWECHGYKPKLPVPDTTEITTGLMDSAEARGAEARANGQLGGLAGAGEAAGLGAGMIAPVLGQVSEVLGESIRELVVIVRWKEGESWQDLQVTTHVVDKTGINQIAGALASQASQIPGLPGSSSGGSSSGGSSSGPGGQGAGGRGSSGRSPSLPSSGGLPRLPGGGMK